MEKIPLTTGEIAQYCHVTHRAVLKWIASGKLKAYRTPGKHSRVETKDFLDFLTLYEMPIPPELRSNGNKKRILIVDDDAGVVSAIRRVLAREKAFDLETAYDGFEAGGKMANFKPDLIILDLNMPGLNGYELCGRIRRDISNKNIKILAISGTVGQKGIDQILSLGADDYLFKPFDNQALKLKVSKLLELLEK